MIQGGSENVTTDIIYDVSKPSIYNLIYQKDKVEILKKNKEYILKVYISSNVTKANITLNSNGTASSVINKFVDGTSLSTGEHTFKFKLDDIHTSQYIRIFLDGDSSKCSKFEIIDTNVTTLDKLNKKTDYIFVSVNMFNSIGAIGDSYTAGSVEHSDKSWTKEKEHSYIATIAKRAGIEWGNYGVPGATTRTYLNGLNGEVGMNLVTSAKANDFYFLALGINDVDLLGLSYLGTITDITSNNANNPDTFFGNYARIIEKTMAHAPKAKLCMILPPFKSNDYPAFREAVKEIAQHYSIPYIDPFDDPAFTNPLYTSMTNGHPTLAGYSAMGLAYERLFSKMVEKNIEYFRYATIG
jgi:lysophospholipase L1-like esterase